MARYVFDIHESGSVVDDTGGECGRLDEVRDFSLRTLPDVARQQIPKEGDRRTLTVLLTREDGRPVKSATLNFTRQWLSREGKPKA